METTMMDEKAVRSTMHELMEVAKRAFDTHLQTGTGGNISARVVGNNAVVIKPSGVGFIGCTPENLLVVDLEGKILKGSAKPSKDMPFHLGIYGVRPEVNGIVHVHSPWATAWAALGEPIPTVTVQAQSKFGRIPLVPSGPDGSKEASESVVNAFRDQSILVATLQNHGAVGVGKTLIAAEELVELIEETAQIAMLVRLAKGK
jgi:L-fuculose-phosphate aldolase/L-ribulose-5-phosphate 4-epimerase